MAQSAITTSEPCSLMALGFKVISNGTSYYNPSEQQGSRPDDEPSLIVLCSWAFAQSRHIAKYVTPYQTLFPGCPILLIQNVVANAIWRTDISQHNFFAPAAKIVHQHISTESPQILVHVFSNGGSHGAVQLSEVYQRIYGQLIPVAALLMDSCPGQPRFVPTVNALVAPMKNPVAKIAVGAMSWAMVLTTAFLDILEVCEPAAFKLYRKLNDENDAFLFKTELHTVRVIPRAYFYSEADTMILADDVRGHAEVAKKKLRAAGFKDRDFDGAIRLEEFVGTAHVNHVKSEATRYWDIVKSTWQMAQRKQLHNVEEGVQPQID